MRQTLPHQHARRTETINQKQSCWASDSFLSVIRKNGLPWAEPAAAEPVEERAQQPGAARGRLGPYKELQLAAATGRDPPCRRAHNLRARLLLLLLVQSEQRHARDLHDLETHTGDITDGVAAATEARDQHLVVLVHVVQAAIARHEGGDLLRVLDQLHTARLANGRVGLLGLNAAATHQQIIEEQSAT
ncbi:hypothetical protein ON010_g6571 [Phytophthora cinnamomi]|nr:hypothetical protein ON010_g6571 [Phytophthora cinnamomi]